MFIVISFFNGFHNYINSLHIKKYKILEALKMEFQVPKNNQNTVNVIAGVNGSGKTTLLQWILERLNSLDSDSSHYR